MERDGKEKEGAKERKRKGRKEFAPIDIKKSQRLYPSRLFIYNFISPETGRQQE